MGGREGDRIGGKDSHVIWDGLGLARVTVRTRARRAEQVWLVSRAERKRGGIIGIIIVIIPPVAILAQAILAQVAQGLSLNPGYSATAFGH